MLLKHAVTFIFSKFALHGKKGSNGARDMRNGRSWKRRQWEVTTVETPIVPRPMNTIHMLASRWNARFRIIPLFGGACQAMLAARANQAFGDAKSIIVCPQKNVIISPTHYHF